jgi:hypothetical protein
METPPLLTVVVQSLNQATEEAQPRRFKFDAVHPVTSFQSWPLWSLTGARRKPSILARAPNKDLPDILRDKLTLSNPTNWKAETQLSVFIELTSCDTEIT